VCAVLQRTVTAMAKVGIPAEQREAVFGTVAAVLHLGNISFVEGPDADSSKVAPGDAQQHLQAAGEPARTRHPGGIICRLQATVSTIITSAVC